MTSPTPPDVREIAIAAAHTVPLSMLDMRAWAGSVADAVLSAVTPALRRRLLIDVRDQIAAEGNRLAEKIEVDTYFGNGVLHAARMVDQLLLGEPAAVARSHAPEEGS